MGTLIRNLCTVEELIFVFSTIRISGSAFRLSVLSVILLVVAGFGSYAVAQTTAPQLLPYTAKLLAGGGSTAATKGAACSRAGATPSGYVSYDTYGDGCLATEIVLATPHSAVLDKTGAVVFADYKNGLIRRIDPVTGIVTAIAGGLATLPTRTTPATACSSSDSNFPSDALFDSCLATSTRIPTPLALAVSPAGDIYVADGYYYAVRKISYSNGGVATVIITNGGSSYASAPSVTFSAPPSGGTTATGTAVLTGGVVTSVTIMNAGSGYTSAPTVTFSVAPTGSSTATGTAVYTGVISTVIGAYDGTNTNAKGYTAGCNILSTAVQPAGCLLYDPYGITFDNAGDLLIADYEYNTVVAVNTNASGTTTVGNVSIAAGTEAKIMGERNGTVECVAGTGSSTTGGTGCNYGNYSNGASDITSQLDAPQGVAVDSAGNIYVADQEDNSVALISAATGTKGVVTNYAGAYPLLGYGTRDANTTRGPAGFSIGSTFDVATDPTNNLYVTDATAGIAWRIDATTQTMYAVGGGATAPAAGSACAASGPGASLTATDAYGDGCPALLASYSFTGTCPGSKCYASTGLYGVYADANANLFLGDQGNNLIREIASGTQFGNTGASQTDYIDIHFAAGDTPPPTGAYAITSGSTIFTIGTATCTKNTGDGSTYTTDCVIPITATPTVSGPYSGTLTVYSTLVPRGTSFPLTGTFVESPITRTVVSSSSTTGCSGTTYATSTPVTLTATLTANGPSAPTGSIIFSANGVALAPVTGVAVTNIGTTSTPVYGATLTYTFSTPNSYTITAMYVPPTGSYFTGSTSSGVSVVSSAPTFTASALSYQGNTVAPGQTALYSFTVATAVYTGTVTFSCSGLPANSSCAFSPSSITATGCSITDTVALSILTQAGTTVQPAGFGGTGGGFWQMLAVLGGVGLALMIGLFRRRIPMRYGQLVMAIALLLAASGMIACGKPVGSVLTPATPAGTSTVTVTATGTDGTVAHFAVPLTVN
jgi:hypothetical protein